MGGSAAASVVGSDSSKDRKHSEKYRYLMNKIIKIKTFSLFVKVMSHSFYVNLSHFPTEIVIC